MKKSSRLLALLLAMSMTLSSCGKANSNSHQEDEKTEKSTQEDKDSRYYSTCLETLDMLNSLFIFESIDCDKEVYEELERLASTKKSCESEQEDYTVLYEAIIENSKPAKESDESLFFTNLNEKGEEQNLARAYLLRSSLKQALEIIFKNSQNDYKEDICLLKDLKMLPDSRSKTPIFYNYQTNTLTINYEHLLEKYISTSQYYSKQEDKTWDINTYFTKIIMLALNSCRGYICNCRLTEGEELESVAHFNEALFALYLAAIESFIKNTPEFDELNKNNYAYEYTKERKAESLLLLYSCFKGKSLEDYHNAIFDTDITKLLEFFELNKEHNGRQGTRDFIMLINSIYGYLVYSDIFYAMLSYEEDTYKSIDEYMIEAYRQSGTYAQQKIYKEATVDLVKSIYKGNYTIEEVIYLYNFLSYHILEESKSPKEEKDSIDIAILEYSESFTRSAKSIDKAFKNFVMKHYGITDEEFEEYRSRLAYKNFEDFCTGQLENIDSQKLLTQFPLISTIQKNHFASPLNIDFFESKESSQKTI